MLYLTGLSGFGAFNQTESEDIAVTDIPSLVVWTEYGNEYQSGGVTPTVEVVATDSVTVGSTNRVAVRKSPKVSLPSFLQSTSGLRPILCPDGVQFSDTHIVTMAAPITFTGAFTVYSSGWRTSLQYRPPLATAANYIALGDSAGDGLIGLTFDGGSELLRVRNDAGTSVTATFTGLTQIFLGRWRRTVSNQVYFKGCGMDEILLGTLSGNITFDSQGSCSDYSVGSGTYACHNQTLAFTADLNGTSSDTAVIEYLSAQGSPLGTMGYGQVPIGLIVFEGDSFANGANSPYGLSLAESGFPPRIQLETSRGYRAQTYGRNGSSVDPEMFLTRDYNTYAGSMNKYGVMCMHTGVNDSYTQIDELEEYCLAARRAGVPRIIVGTALNPAGSGSAQQTALLAGIRKPWDGIATIANIPLNAAQTPANHPPPAGYQITSDYPTDSWAATIDAVDAESILQAYLQFAWKGDDLYDSRSYAHLRNNGSATFVSGKVGNAFQLTAASSQSVSYTLIDDMFFGAIDKLTIAMWINVDSIDGGETRGVMNWPGVLSVKLTGQTIVASANNGAGVGSVASTIASTGTWYCVVVVYDGTLTGNSNRLKLYVNDVQKTLSFSGSGVPSTLTPTVPGTIEFGKVSDSGAYYDGKVDIPAIWRCAFDTTQRAAYYNSGSGTESFVPASLAAPPSVLGAPTSLTVSNPTETTLDLSWVAPAGSVTSYNLYRSTTSGDYSNIPVAVGLTGTTYTDEDLTPDTEYFYVLRAESTAGEGAASTEDSGTTDSAAASSLLTGLLLYLKMNESSGTRLDETANSYDFAESGGTISSSTGKIGNAALFVSADSRKLTFTPGADVGITTNFTLSLWSYANTNTNGGLFGQDDGSGVDGLLLVTRLGVGAQQLQITGNGLSWSAATPGASSLPTRWEHIVIAYDGAGATNADRLKVYINGSSQTVTTGSVPTSNPGTTDQMQIGFDSFLGNYFDGLIDEVGLWNVTLDATQIGNLYNSGSGVTYPFAGVP